MNFKFKAVSAVILAVSLAGSIATAQDAKPAVKKHVATGNAKTPTIAEQIQAMRLELERQASQIESLKSGMAAKDAQLQKAERAAADAQAAAARAEAAASSEQQAVGANSAAVTTLQSAVTNLKGSQATLAATVTDETAKIKKAVENPTALRFKGVTITPGGFMTGDTVFRTRATGGGIPTAWSSLPYENADAYSLSEFYGGGNATRLSVLAEGKTNWGTLRGYIEGDFLGVGAGSNANQSNSYDFRMRILYAEAKTNSGWTVAAGQLWSLATEGKKGISSLPADNAGPTTIDPNNTVGFIWTRQYGFRAVKNFGKFALAVSAENPQLLYTATLAGNTPNAVLGSVGNATGNYNSTISSVTATTYVQNYSNLGSTAAGSTYDAPVPVYATLTANTNIANYSFNKAPDMLVKAAFDPGFGHYEIFGIAGFGHETVYPNVTIDRIKFGGQQDIVLSTAAGTATNYLAAANSNGSYTGSIVTGGMGASARVPVIANKLSLGAKGLFGPGVGRYAQSNLSDVTSNASGALTPIHNAAGLLTVEATPTPRLLLYLNYGGEYAGREDYSTPTATTLGSPKAIFCPTSATEAGAFTCTAKPTTANIAAGGAWGGTWTASTTQQPVGYGSHFLSNSACTFVANPGLNGSSTGYYPGTSCGAQTRDVQEITGGYWFDIYKGDHGRLRQGFQYSYAVREGWSGLSGIGAKGVENMFFTSFRYYLP